MTGRCTTSCMTDDGCDCRPSAHDDELSRVDAMGRARRADAILTDTVSDEEAHDFPLRDPLDDAYIRLAERTRGMLS